MIKLPAIGWAVLMKFSRPSICVTVLEEHLLGIGVNRRDCEELYLNDQ